MKKMIFILGTLCLLFPMPSFPAIQVTGSQTECRQEPATFSPGEKTGIINHVARGFAIASFPFFSIGLFLFATRWLMYFFFEFFVLETSYVFLAIAIGLAFTGIVLAVLGRKRPNKFKGLAGIILGAIVIILSSILLFAQVDY